FGGPMSWSPDGHRLAVTTFTSGSPRVALIDVASGQTSPVGPVGSQDPTWSPDGATIVFSKAASTVELWRMAPDGGGLAILLAEPGKNADSPVWSHDGRHIAYQ